MSQIVVQVAHLQNQNIKKTLLMPSKIRMSKKKSLFQSHSQFHNMKDQLHLTNIHILRLELEVKVGQTLTKGMRLTRNPLILTLNRLRRDNLNNILPCQDRDPKDYVSSERRRILEDEFLLGTIDFTLLRTKDLRGLILISKWGMRNSTM